MADIPAQEDRRVRKTLKAIDLAFTKLMTEKNLSGISVKEITDLADINRGTFYLHYKDVYDLLDQTEEKLLGKLFEVLDLFPDEIIITDPVALFRGVYRLCGENSNIVRILISENGDIKFLHRMKKLLREKCLENWGATLRKHGSRDFEARYSFVVGGCLELLQYWFENGMKESPEELAQTSGEFILGLAKQNDVSS